MHRLVPFIVALFIYGCAQIPPTNVQQPTLTQAQAVITDIDGTLTPKNISVYTARLGAADALNALSKKGYLIVYITARNPLFQSGLQDWLSQKGFPSGTLHVAQTMEERAEPDKFKWKILATYTRAGWRLAYAYGDSPTDFTAYAEAEIPKERVFALKREGSMFCEAGVYGTCLDGWIEHMPYINIHVPDAQ